MKSKEKAINANVPSRFRIIQSLRNNLNRSPDTVESRSPIAIERDDPF